MSDLVTNVREVYDLPDGTILEPTVECRWPGRYAGTRWRKDGTTIENLADTSSVALIVFWKDPLPAKVIPDGE